MFELGHRLDEVCRMLDELQCTPREYTEVVDAFCEASGQIKEILCRCTCGETFYTHTPIVNCPRCLKLLPICAACRFGNCSSCRNGSMHSERAPWWRGDDLAFDDFDLRYFRLVLDRAMFGDTVPDIGYGDDCGDDGVGDCCVEFGCDHCIDMSSYPETALRQRSAYFDQI